MNYARHYSAFWRLYFFVAAAAAFVSLLAGGVTSSELFFELPLLLISLFPLYGYAWQRRISPKWLWIGTFALSVVLVGAATLVGVAGLLFGEVTPGFSGFFLLWLSLLAPYLFALYQYLFRSPHLWGQGA